MEQRDILEGNDEKFCFSRDCNVTQFLKTFGEWSNATFSRATRRNFDLAETVTLPITVTLRRMEHRDILEGNA